ncbi:tetratricopeptide repeat protein, partial [Acidobacteriota bacterium]
GEDSLFTMVDDLTRRIKEDFQLSADEIATDIDEDVGKITTSSPDALKYYREGLIFQEGGDYTGSISPLETAAGLDPDFAMAFRALAVSYSEMGYESESRDRLRKAFDLADRLSDREKYHIQGQFYSQSERNYDKAIEAYQKLLEIYPNDPAANNNLGEIYLSLEDWDNAVKWFSVNKKIRDKAVQPYLNLAHAYSAKGQWDEAQEVLEDYIDGISDNKSVHLQLARIFLAQGNLEKAKEKADLVYSMDPSTFKHIEIWGDILLFQGRFEEAENEYGKLLEVQEPAAHNLAFGRLWSASLLQGKVSDAVQFASQGIELAEMIGQMGWKSSYHFKLAYTYNATGEYDLALEQCNEAWSTAMLAEDIDTQRSAFHFKGLIYSNMGRVEDANNILQELKNLVDSGMNQSAVRHFLHLKSILDLERGNTSDAVRDAETALRYSPHTCGANICQAVYMDTFGSALFESGNTKKALKIYENIVNMTSGRIFFGDVYVLGFYWKGKVLQEMGATEDALESFNRFLSLRENAEFSTSEIEDARSQISKLSSR